MAALLVGLTVAGSARTALAAPGQTDPAPTSAPTTAPTTTAAADAIDLVLAGRFVPPALIVSDPWGASMRDASVLVRNAASVPARAVTVTYTAPAGVRLVFSKEGSGPQDWLPCTGGVETLTCTLAADLPAGATAWSAVHVLNVSLPAGSTVEVTEQVSSAVADPNPADNAWSNAITFAGGPLATVAGSPRADLWLRKDAVTVNPASGEVVLSWTVLSTGPDAAADLTVSFAVGTGLRPTAIDIVLPPGLWCRFDPLTTPAGPTTVTCTLPGSVPLGDRIPVTMRAVPSDDRPEAAVSVWVAVTADAVDPDPTNNAAQVVVERPGPPATGTVPIGASGTASLPLTGGASMAGAVPIGLAVVAAGVVLLSGGVALGRRRGGTRAARPS